jgi:hypothetical protein
MGTAYLCCSVFGTIRHLPRSFLLHNDITVRFHVQGGRETEHIASNVGLLWYLLNIHDEHMVMSTRMERLHITGTRMPTTVSSDPKNDTRMSALQPLTVCLNKGRLFAAGP